MGTLTVVLLLLFGYILKGVVWVVIDVYFFKIKYNNVLETLFGLILWPLLIVKRILDFLKKKYFNY